MLSSSSRRAAAASERAAGRSRALVSPPPFWASSSSTASTAASIAASSAARIAITRSFGPASSIVKPWPASSSRLSGVAMPTDTSSPVAVAAARETSISVTES